MARVAGVDIPNDKKVPYSIRSIYGIGPALAREITNRAGVDPDTRVRDLTEVELNHVREAVERGGYAIEGDLRREVGLMCPVHVADEGGAVRKGAESSIMSYLRMVGIDLGGAYVSRGEEPPPRLQRYSESGFDVVTEDKGAIGDAPRCSTRCARFLGR